MISPEAYASVAPQLYLLPISGMAFSAAVRALIHERDRVCVDCGSDVAECSHIDHDKAKPTYDTPQNGRLQCIYHHLQDHINRAGRNGLSKMNNDCAIKSLQKRLRCVKDSRRG